jgi:hypothetical protein
MDSGFRGNDCVHGLQMTPVPMSIVSGRRPSAVLPSACVERRQCPARRPPLLADAAEKFAFMAEPRKSEKRELS